MCQAQEFGTRIKMMEWSREASGSVSWEGSHSSPQECKALHQSGPHCLNHIPGTVSELWKVKARHTLCLAKNRYSLKAKEARGHMFPVTADLSVSSIPWLLLGMCLWFSEVKVLDGVCQKKKNEGIGESSADPGEKKSVFTNDENYLSVSPEAFRSFQVSLSWEQATVHLRC